MNKMKLHNIKEKDMFDQAIEALRQAAGLQIEVTHYEPAVEHKRADACSNMSFSLMLCNFILFN